MRLANSYFHLLCAGDVGLFSSWCFVLSNRYYSRLLFVVRVMGKRSNFERNPRDYYPTPYDAVIPLIPFLEKGSTFVEPCAGDGRLINHLQRHGLKCVGSFDIEPQAENIEQQDVLFFNFKLAKSDFIITNPPWEREVLHQMIETFRIQAPTWLLFDSDWMFTKQSNQYKKFCKMIVTVGRVSWMENGTSGMDNCCWYLFDKDECETVFI